MDKKILKVIYKFRYNITGSKPTIDIARTIKNKFELQESLSFLSKYITEHFPKKANSIYTEFEKNLLFRLYCCRTERKKIVDYFNKKYGKSLTIEALSTMMNKY